MGVTVPDCAPVGATVVGEPSAVGVTVARESPAVGIGVVESPGESVWFSFDIEVGLFVGSSASGVGVVVGVGEKVAFLSSGGKSCR